MREASKPSGLNWIRPTIGAPSPAAVLTAIAATRKGSNEVVLVIMLLCKHKERQGSS